MSNREGFSEEDRVTSLINSADVVEHFTARSTKYDWSSRWCNDPELMKGLNTAACPRPTDKLLDVACGTGLVSAAFKGKVASIMGLDLTPAMMAHAVLRADELTLGSAEAMPFPEESFDLVVCRQGIQFMEAQKAVAEMVRVTRRGGRIVLIDLCAYGDERKEFFKILKLRNPARRNFFVPEDLVELLRRAGCTTVSNDLYVCRENVDLWSANGAISEHNRAEIRTVYRNATSVFQRLHTPEYAADGTIVDHMLFAITLGLR